MPQLGPWTPAMGWSVILVLLALLIFVPDKLLAIRLLSVLCGYVFFQGLITLRSANVVGYTTHHTYYYGSSFPIFALLALAPLLTSRLGHAAAIVIVPYVFVAQTANFLRLNNDARLPLEAQSYPPYITARYPGVGYNKPLTFAKTPRPWSCGEQYALGNPQRLAPANFRCLIFGC